MKTFLEIKKMILKINPIGCAFDSVIVLEERHQFRQALPVLCQGEMLLLIKWQSRCFCVAGKLHLLLLWI